MALAAIVFGLMICVLHGKQLPQFFATQACSTNLTKVGNNASGSKSHCLFGHNITQDDDICSTHLRSMRKDSMLPCYVCKQGVTVKTRKSAVNLECFTRCHLECDKKNHFAHNTCYKNSEKKRPAPSAVPAYSNHGGGTMRCDAYGGGAIRGDSDGDTMRGDDVDCALEEQAQKTQEKMGNMLRFARLFQGAVAQPQHALSLPPPEDSAVWLTSLASVAISTLRNGSLQSAASNTSSILELDGFRVCILPNSNKGAVDLSRTQMFEKKRVLLEVANAISTPTSKKQKDQRDQLSLQEKQQQHTLNEDAVYAALFRSDPERFTALARANLSENNVGAVGLKETFNLSVEQTWEVISASNCPPTTLDSIGQYCFRSHGNNPFSSSEKRDAYKKQMAPEMISRDFHVRIKDDQSTVVCYTRIADVKKAVTSWLVGHHLAGDLVWEHGMLRSSLRVQLLIDKGGDQVSMLLKCYNILEGNSPNNTLSLGVLSGKNVQESYEIIKTAFGPVITDTLELSGLFKIDLSTFPTGTIQKLLPNYDDSKCGVCECDVRACCDDDSCGCGGFQLLCCGIFVHRSCMESWLEQAPQCDLCCGACGNSSKWRKQASQFSLILQANVTEARASKPHRRLMKQNFIDFGLQQAKNKTKHVSRKPTPSTAVNHVPAAPVVDAAPQLFCTCRTPFDPNLAMILCSSCDDWLHQTCEDLSDADFEKAKGKKTYKCTRCVKGDSGFTSDKPALANTNETAGTQHKHTRNTIHAHTPHTQG